MQLEPQEISIDVLQEKYAKNEEKDITAIQHRVAKALASVEIDKEYWYNIFLQTQKDGFIPGGRINSAAGINSESTLINCFVQPVGDSISSFDDDNYPSIYDAIKQAAETMRRGGGVGYDFSRIRPLNAYVKGTQSYASGPISYMKVFDASCLTVESAGGRRGAQMAVLRCDHPDILNFITAKGTKGELNNFNCSVGVTDEFMRTVEKNGEWKLIHKAKPCDDYIKKNNSYFDENLNKWVWKIIPVSDIWDLIMKSTYDFAEPGILFLDRMNEENNLYYCETIETTNPCAEQPLPPYGCCDLGSINLTKFVVNPFKPDAWFDYNKFKTTIINAVRMLDNVLDVTAWPLEQQRIEAMNKRRIGLGFLGIGDTIIMLNKFYNKTCGVDFAKEISKFLRNTAYLASIELSREKGPFPFFNKKYLDSKFILRLPEFIRERISEYGIRNSHLLSVAPTGTISLAFADNASNGIEPPFSWVYDRKKRMSDGSYKTFEVADHAWRLYRAMGHDMEKLPANFITALEMDVNAHIDIMKAVQPYIDTSISKCVAKGTPIITNKGILPIEALGNAYIKDTFSTPIDDLKVLCPDGKWRKVTAHYYGGRKKTIFIQLSNGQIIEASENHKLMTTDNWVSMSNLKVGNYIKVKQNIKLNYPGNLPINNTQFNKNNDEYFIPENMSEQLALFLGLIAANGYLSKPDGLISITENNEVISKYFTNLANTLFGITNIVHIIDFKDNTNIWYFVSEDICKWISNLIGYDINDRYIPREIMCGSRNEMIMFLKGLGFSKYKSEEKSTYIYFGESKQLALQSFSLLKALGYNPELVKKKIENCGYLIYGTSAKNINFYSEEEHNIENSYNFDKKDFIYLRIEKIEKGTNEIYDIEVKDSHDYLIDGVVSHNTVNIPADYPYEDFKNLYIYAWKSNLKGLATYRPNNILGSVLSTKEEKSTTSTINKDIEEKNSLIPIIDKDTKVDDNDKTLDEIITEMYTQPFESREDGSLPGISIKGRFYTNQGEQKFIITINFLTLVRHTKFGKITIRRPVEFILTSNFTASSSAWNAAMRFLSLIGRSGGSIVKAIENLKEITWEHGNVKYGIKTENDKKIPLWHSSDAAAIGYIIEEALIKDGYLTKDGKLIKKYLLENELSEINTNTTINTTTLDVVVMTKEQSSIIKDQSLLTPTGKKCPNCGAFNLIKYNGCEHCEACGYEGSCG